MALRFLYSFLFSLLFLHQVFANDGFEKFEEKGKYGLRSAVTGKIIFDAQYDDIGWSEGEFQIINNRIGLKQNEKWALASLDGSKITRHYYSVLYPFKNDVFIVGQRSNFSILNEFGAINSKGVSVISIEYQWISPIGNGLIVSKRKGIESVYGLLNTNGNPILPLKFKDISQVDTRTLAVQNNAGIYALYSSQGKVLSDFLYETILHYSENIYKVTSFNKEGLIDRTGGIIVPPEFKSINYSNGKAQVLPFDKWTIFIPNEEPRTLYHDNVLLITALKAAIQTNNNSGIISLPNNEYKYYQPNSRIAEASNGLVIIQKDSLFGAVNENGNSLLPFQFDSILVFKNIIYAKLQEKNGRDWVPYNLNGRRIGIHLYEEVREEKNGNFLAIKNDKYGILNLDGGEETPFIFDHIGEFDNGLAVASYQGNQGVIKTNGNWLITPYKDALKTINNLIFYQQGTEYGVYDLFERQIFRSNTSIIPFQNAFAQNTNDGYLLYSTRGNLLSEQKYDSIYEVNPNLLVLKRRAKLQLFNIEQQLLFKLDPRIQTVRSHSEELISILMEDHWGFISEQGLLTIANRYQEAKDYSEGLSAVNINGSWGYIDLKDRIAIQPTLQMAGSFKNGIAIVKTEGKYGLINAGGNYILDAIYDTLIQSEGYIQLEKNGLKGFATSNGTLIRSPQFDTISTTDGIHFIVSKNGKFGVVDIAGLDRVAILFDHVEQLGDTFLAMEKQN